MKSTIISIDDKRKEKLWSQRQYWIAWETTTVGMRKVYIAYSD
jgi:hypothetical protein